MDFIIRRIRKSEIQVLREFCSSQDVEQAPFTHHKIWLESVLKELDSGKNSRVAFGAFFPIVKGDILTYEIVGCLFLKRSNFDNSVELKSLLTRKELHDDSKSIDSTVKDYQYNIKKQLLEKAIRFCEIRDFPKIEMELLQDEMKTEVSLLLNLGFRISFSREKYTTGRYVSVLEKHIGDIYRSDPFDDAKILRWLVQTMIPSKIISGIKTRFDDSLGCDITSVKFSKFPLSPSLNNLKSTSKRDVFNIHGEVVLLRKEAPLNLTDNDIENCFDPNVKSHIKFLISDDLSESAIKICAKFNIQTLSFDLLKEFAGGDESSMQVPFSSNDVGGVITVLEKDAILNLINEARDFAYYLVSGIGKAINKSENKSLLAIYCPHWDGIHKGGIVGYANIVYAAEPTYIDASSTFSDCYQALSEDDIDFYRRGNDDNELLKVLRCEEIRLFENVMPLDSLNKLINNSYVVNQLEKNLASAVYLSEEIVNHMLSQPIANMVEFRNNRLPHSGIKNNRSKVFLSFSHINKQNSTFNFIKNKLNHLGYKAIVDEEILKPGDSIVDFSKINDLQAGISFFSKDSLHSLWFGSELSHFFKLEETNKSFEWFPLCLDQSLNEQLVSGEIKDSVVRHFQNELKKLNDGHHLAHPGSRTYHQLGVQLSDSIWAFNHFFDLIASGERLLSYVDETNMEDILNRIVTRLEE